MRVLVVLFLNLIPVLCQYRFSPNFFGTCPNIRCVPLPDSVPRFCRFRPLIFVGDRLCFGCERLRERICCPRPCPPLPPGTPPTCISEIFINGPFCPFCETLAPECAGRRRGGRRRRGEGRGGGGTDDIPSCPNITCLSLVGIRQECILSGRVTTFNGRPCRGCSTVIPGCN